MIERLSPIDRAAAALVLSPPAVTRSFPQELVPVILTATREELPGAVMRVGGLRVIDRALRQMARLRDVRVTVISDGSIRLPRRLPAHIEVRRTENAKALLEQLKNQLDDPMIVGADVVRVQGNRL